ncbi:hypothetical protein SBV1_250008 [Verrucomicrobia bacterium]|nr:hypothetical protein SBV1_250008 [Verrucomicrobiota bacterium]
MPEMLAMRTTKSKKFTEGLERSGMRSYSASARIADISGKTHFAVMGTGLEARGAARPREQSSLAR